ncbi:MAG: AmmeMemoRadiSam system protein B [Syntrophobacteraceae bacterium]|nr:AmmeMemoRadiSam system protein B [Syntrophobacteraceae bacterium]
MSAEKIRESVIAGTWYPSDPVLLKRELAGYLDLAEPQALEGELIGLVAPHAGFLYSGGVAAWSYKLLSKKMFDRVLIMAPSHRVGFTGASVSAADGYRTPLGVVPLDRELIEELRKYSELVGYNPQAESGEHSLEIQLPFLQVVLGDFRLTPLLIGTRAPEFCVKLSEAIAQTCCEKRILLIASSDLSHYYPAETARRLDGVFLKLLEAFDPQGLAVEVENQRTQACGAGPVITWMHAGKKLGGNRCKVLHYANSADVTGDNSEVVGYAAAALYGGAQDG